MHRNKTNVPGWWPFRFVAPSSLCRPLLGSLHSDEAGRPALQVRREAEEFMRDPRSWARKATFHWPELIIWPHPKAGAQRNAVFPSVCEEE